LQLKPKKPASTIGFGWKFLALRGAGWRGETSHSRGKERFSSSPSSKSTALPKPSHKNAEPAAKKDRPPSRIVPWGPEFVASLGFCGLGGRGIGGVGRPAGGLIHKGYELAPPVTT
jgi:hypothetical protein